MGKVEQMATTNSPRKGAERPAALIRTGLTSAPMPRIELDARSAYDFLMSSCYDCGELADLLPEDREWLKKGRERLLSLTMNCGSCTAFGTELGRLLLGRPEIRTARQLVAALDELDDATVLKILVEELLESQDYGDLTRRALDGDKAAFGQLRDQLEGAKGHPVLPDNPGQLVPALRRALHEWLPEFEQVEPRVTRMLERDLASRDTSKIAADPMGFVESVTNGVRLYPEPAIKRIVLSPTYYGRPYNSMSRVGDTQVVLYPIADAALGAAGMATPPVATVRLYRALGDETRLRILRLLAERDRYLTELAAELELSKPTVSHHLAQLRSAGLVTWNEQGNLTYYTLRRDRIREAGPELSAFLAH